MTCISSILMPQYNLFMQQNRFTYSPAIDPALRAPLSFKDFQSRNSAQLPAQNAPWATSYTPPALTSYTPYTPSAGLTGLPSFTPPAVSSAYAASSFTNPSYSLPPNRQITFGQPQSSSIGEPTRITFNQSGGFPSLPTYNSGARPVLSGVSEESKKVEGAPVIQTEGVNPFVVDTNEFKFVKEDEFTGCFHCFSPVTYDTKAKKGLCG